MIFPLLIPIEHFPPSFMLKMLVQAPARRLHSPIMLRLCEKGHIQCAASTLICLISQVSNSRLF